MEIRDPSCRRLSLSPSGSVYLFRISDTSQFSFLFKLCRIVSYAFACLAYILGDSTEKFQANHINAVFLLLGWSERVDS